MGRIRMSSTCMFRLCEERRCGKTGLVIGVWLWTGAKWQLLPQGPPAEFWGPASLQALQRAPKHSQWARGTVTNCCTLRGSVTTGTKDDLECSEKSGGAPPNLPFSYKAKTKTKTKMWRTTGSRFFLHLKIIWTFTFYSKVCANIPTNMYMCVRRSFMPVSPMCAGKTEFHTHELPASSSY